MTERETGVTRWDPFAELDLFDRPIGRSGRDLLHRVWGRPEGGGLMPALDIAEDDEKYVITVELAGAKKDDVTVEVHDGTLTIRGEKRSEREETREQSRYVERRYGSFSRSFSLPANADPHKVEAGFKDGVLTVTLAKATEAKPRTVSIQS